MDEGPAYLQAVSLHVSRTLDEIGLNKITLLKRRKTFLFGERMGHTHFRLAGDKVFVYHFGSQTEGSTTPGLNSDVDMLKCGSYVKVIQTWDEWDRDKINLLILQDETAPGYCRLQYLRSDLPLAENTLLNKHCIFDRNGKVILINTALHRSLSEYPVVRNGPAMSTSAVSGAVDMDSVMAFECQSWPDQAQEFATRHRRHGWPNHHVIQQAVTHGVFLVPVGYKLSLTEHLEWRLSASLAERCLLFSLNLVHIKCYVLLKMLVTTFVEPYVTKCISSYHCKTAVLHCAESTDTEFWRDGNILQCVDRCLAKLLTWVTNGFCPHFIMPEENLFVGKVTIQNKGILQSVLKELIQSNGRALLCVRIDTLGKKLQSKLNTVPSFTPVVDSLDSVILVGVLEINRQLASSEWFRQTLVKDLCSKPVTVIQSVYARINVLKGNLDYSNPLEQEVIRTFIEFLSCWLGSLMSSIALSHKVRIPRQAIRFLGSGSNCDISSMLKLGSVLYFRGDLHKLEDILQRLHTHFCRTEIQLVCRCYDKPAGMSLAFSHTMYMSNSRKARAQLFAHCVRFSPQETHCIPPALQKELHRSVGDEGHRSIYDEWMDLAVVDCIPYLYYLLYITYKGLGKQDLQKWSLDSLDQCVRENHHFSHLETAWNILGQCQELEQKPEVAMACYKTSLKIRPKYNAAKWHVAVLWFKLMSNK